MKNPNNAGPVAEKGIWTSPAQPAGRWGYGANSALFTSAVDKRDRAHCGWNTTDIVFNDQNCDGSPVRGGGAAPSVAQSSLPAPGSTLMVTTVGVIPGATGNLVMSSMSWWWEGCDAKIPGGTIPPNWDADNSAGLDCSLKSVGPATSLPRFRYSGGIDVLYADGHVKFKKKGSLNWCSDMFVPGSTVDVYDTEALDDSNEFVNGVCQGYSQN